MPAAAREEAEAAKAAGNEAFKARAFQEAVQAYSRAIALDPSCAVYHSNRAQAYLQASIHSLPTSPSKAEACALLQLLYVHNAKPITVKYSQITAALPFPPDLLPLVQSAGVLGWKACRALLSAPQCMAA